MLPLPAKTAFAFSDTAGANACMALARILRKATGLEPMLYSNRRIQADDLPGFRLTDEIPDFDRKKTDCLFTGTSHPASSRFFEVDCLKRARSRSIYTVSFVDHWVNFYLRFTDREGKQEYPSAIWVVDAKARELAIGEGIPAELLHIHSNPYHIYLKESWRPAFRDKEYLTSINIPAEGYHILFAPDPVQERNPAAGFTETGAFISIMDAIEQIKSPVHLIVRPHPLHAPDFFNDLVPAKSDINIHICPNGDVLELIHSADLVVGFYSNLLLEAHAMGKPVIRYFPGSPGADLLQHQEGMLRVSDKETLREEFKTRIHG